MKSKFAFVPILESPEHEDTLSGNHDPRGFSHPSRIDGHQHFSILHH